MKIWLSALLLLLSQCYILGQGAHYWSQNFNEESSLLSGAVVGGGAGNASVYYNPASIAESEGSSLAVNASLFSLDFYSAKNALGDDINLSSTKITLQPRFISYNWDPSKTSKFSFEFIIMNTQLYDLQFNNSVSYQMDILEYLPGEERYFANFSYNNYYREDWVGGGASYALNDHFYLGASMFVKVKSMRYNSLVDIQAHSLTDTVEVGGIQVPFYSASYNEYQDLKFNNYRLIWKFSMFYLKDRFTGGITISTPSLNVYSDGKMVSKKFEQSNISNPVGVGFLPNIMIIDYRDKKGVNINYKDPLSIAAGAVFKTRDNKQAVYTTVEYFFPVDPYKIVQVDPNPMVSNSQTYSNLPTKEFLSYGYANTGVFNAAVGYQWTPREHLRLLGGFRTDFNYQKGLDYGEYIDYNSIRQITYDLYHLTGGAVFTFKGQDIMFGLQYTLGYQGNEPQIINLSDPVEFNIEEQAALQGTRSDNMRNIANKVGVFFGATFNFMTGKTSK